jgi:hypothetical protein
MRFVQTTRGIDVEDEIDFILDNLDELSGWETNFACSVAGRSGWTESQQAVIKRIAARLRRMARAA